MTFKARARKILPPEPTPGKHASPEPASSVWKTSWEYVLRSRKIWFWSLAAIVFFMGHFLWLNYNADGMPIEHARLIRTGSLDGTSPLCGQHNPLERATYLSLDPPKGLPAEITADVCLDDIGVDGTVAEIRRQGPDHTGLEVNPVTTWGREALIILAICGAAAFGAMLYLAYGALMNAGAYWLSLKPLPALWHRIRQPFRRGPSS